MNRDYGVLILVQQGGPEREFGLSKAKIGLGRGLANDIVLADPRVSREHARIECGPQGCTVIDLDSANSTQLNGRRIDRAGLTPGDVLSLGDCRLRYQATAPAEDLGLTRLDSEADLALKIGRAHV